MLRQRKVKIERNFIAYGWDIRYLLRLEFYYCQLIGKDDFDRTRWESHRSNASSDEDSLEPLPQQACDATSILHLSVPAGQFFSHLLFQVLHVYFA